MIDYNLYDCRYHDNTWFDSGGPNENRLDDEQVKQIYEDCTNKRCYTLADGVLTICGKITSIKEIHKTQENACHEVDFRKSNSIPLLKKELEIFMNNSNIFKESCRYCLGTYGKIPAAIQLK